MITDHFLDWQRPAKKKPISLTTRLVVNTNL